MPARYVTCYAHRLDPRDFHACFEVFIGGSWHVFDPTRLAPLNGLVRIATGRDAADVAVCTIFGNPELTRSWVSCDCDDVNFIPLTHDDLVRGNMTVVLSSGSTPVGQWRQFGSPPAAWISKGDSS